MILIACLACFNLACRSWERSRARAKSHKWLYSQNSSRLSRSFVLGFASVLKVIVLCASLAARCTVDDVDYSDLWTPTFGARHFVEWSTQARKSDLIRAGCHAYGAMDAMTICPTNQRTNYFALGAGEGCWCGMDLGSVKLAGATLACLRLAAAYSLIFGLMMFDATSPLLWPLQSSVRDHFRHHNKW